MVVVRHGLMPALLCELIPQIIEAVWIFARIRRAPAKSLLLECQIQRHGQSEPLTFDTTLEAVVRHRPEQHR